MPDSESLSVASAIRQPSLAAAEPPKIELATECRAAFRAGWIMAQLYEPLLERDSGDAEGHLPSTSELPREQRVQIALRELEHDLALAARGAGHEAALAAVTGLARSGQWHLAFKLVVARLHEVVLAELTVQDASLGRAYGLGRSLSDTAWLPQDEASFREQLNPYRVAEIDGWLSDLTAALGRDQVTAVRGSLRTWSRWIADPFLGRRRLNWVSDRLRAEQSLRRQGAVWRDLLSGAQDPGSLLSADAYAEAADLAVHRIGRLAARVLLHFWYATASVLAVAGALAYVACAYAAGTAKFWGVLVTAVGGSGALVQGVRAGMSRLARSAEAPIWQLVRDDALAVGATRLPAGATAGHVRRRVTERRYSAPRMARTGREDGGDSEDGGGSEADSGTRVGSGRGASGGSEDGGSGWGAGSRPGRLLASLMSATRRLGERVRRPGGR